QRRPASLSIGISQRVTDSPNSFARTLPSLHYKGNGTARGDPRTWSRAPLTTCCGACAASAPRKRPATSATANCWSGSSPAAEADLRARSLAGREETSFAILAQRHGPMVLGVCQRVLRDAHAAEDAFQAAFLVLVRRSASIRKRDSLASWLYGVAQRIALRV